MRLPLNSRTVLVAPLTALSLLVAGCSTFGAAGPATQSVRNADDGSYAAADIAVVTLDGETTRRLASHANSQTLAETFGPVPNIGPLIQRGDVVDVAIWEAPPAVLFGTASNDPGDAMVAGTTVIPEQSVDTDGTIMVPFVGLMEVAGRSPAQVQQAIVNSLNGRAHDPQVVVRLVGNNGSSATVLGDVAESRRVPLTARGERLLEVLAEAGGPTEAVGKTTVRLTRGDLATTMPLERIILDPAQNIPLHAGDVVTVMHQPYSFVALGAVQQSAEIPFEGSGLSLAEAIGRVGGLRDDRADIRGVFVFRFEDPAALSSEVAADATTTMDGMVPVIYRLDLSEPASFFVARDFAVRDEDILYVSSAPGADLQRFLSTLSGVALSGIAIGNSL